MPVFKKTYISPVGDHAFYDPDLALGVIYSFSQNGQVDFVEVPWQDGPFFPAGGEFMYNPANGHIVVNPDTPFLPGYLTVIYKAEGIPIPPPPEPPLQCEVPGTPVASIFNNNQVRVTMPESGDYLLRMISGPGDCGDVAIEEAVITAGTTYTFPVYQPGFYKVCVRRNCGGGLVSANVVSNIVEIQQTPANFGARKIPADTAIKIVSVTGIALSPRTGSYPLVSGGQEIRARHENFVGQIRVNITVKKNQQVVVGLYKNGPLVQFIAVNQNTTGAAFVLFNSISATPDDDIFVALDYT